MSLVIIDYGRGNLFSLTQALRHLDQPYQISDDPKVIECADRLILPGVGAFGDAMENLKSKDLVSPIQHAAGRGVPLLGICLGMQMLCDASEEFGLHRGLGLIPGTVARLPDNDGGPGLLRIPNVGWRKLLPHGNDPVLGDLSTDQMCYFVHSFAATPTYPDHLIATIDFNGHHVAAAIRKDNVIGFQFHPEKSAEGGIAMLSRFLKLT